MKFSNLFDEEEVFCEQRLMVLVDTGQVTRRSDGRVDLNLGRPVRVPWIYIKRRQSNCALYNENYREYFDFIPQFCMNSCWKTVVKPSKVADLFRLYQTMRALDLPSKCGLETRVLQGGFRGFFYADDLETAKEHYKEAKPILNETLDYPYEIFIKRACTEMEDQFGPSDKWETNPKWLERERYLERIIVHPIELYGEQADWHKRFIMREWIRRTCKTDDTYKEIVDKHDLAVPTVCYQEEPDERRGDIKTGGESGERPPADPRGHQHRLEAIAGDRCNCGPIETVAVQK
jgi:hypothetical protein